MIREIFLMYGLLIVFGFLLFLTIKLVRKIYRAIRQIPWHVQYAYRWCTEAEFRNDINYRRWGVRTSEIKGSSCGCCGNYIAGDPGDPEYPPDWRWTLCDRCCIGCSPRKYGPLEWLEPTYKFTPMPS